MEPKTIHINTENIVYVSFHTDYDAKTIKTVDELLDILISSIRFNKQIGYAGFSTKKALRSWLEFNVFGKYYRKGQLRKFPVFLFKKTEILREFTLSLKKCLRKLPTKSTWIFVFPTFNPFIKNKLGGTAGFAPRKHAILLTLHPKAKKWKEQLSATLVHEFNHSIRFHHFPLQHNNTLLDAIILEGLADNFAQRIVNGKPSPWTTALSLQQCKKVFPKIRKLLKSKSRTIHYSVFFEGKKYPLWTGYSLGYQIVKQFLQNNPKMDWQRLMRLRSEKIFKESGF